MPLASQKPSPFLLDANLLSQVDEAVNHARHWRRIGCEDGGFLRARRGKISMTTMQTARRVFMREREVPREYRDAYREGFRKFALNT